MIAAYQRAVKEIIEKTPHKNYIESVISFSNPEVVKAVSTVMDVRDADELSDIASGLAADGTCKDIGYFVRTKDCVLLEVNIGAKKRSFMATVKKISKKPAVYGWYELNTEPYQEKMNESV